ncbi:MAG TPA: SDR family NAD(P)-dependent oxidoreductase, partial [Chthoniobacterales bacterium]
MYEFIGRVDQQVKVRGFRVELGEIETVLGSLPGVRAAAVVQRVDSSGHAMLVAFWVPQESRRPAASSERFTAQLKTRLPDYMVPVRFEALRALPLTPNAKVDRQFLKRTSLDEITAKMGLDFTGTAAPETTVRLLGPPEFCLRLRRIAADVLQVSEDTLDPAQPLGELGFDSIRFTALSTRLNRQFGLDLDATLFYHHKTLQNTAEFLLAQYGHKLIWEEHRESAAVPESFGNHSAAALSPVPLPATELAAQSNGDSALETSGVPGAEPVAIIGLDARLPGAPDLATFWENLLSGKDGVGPLPKEREQLAGTEPGEAISGGFIADVDKFDAQFFNISPREAATMDPRQRLFLESAWRAVENAGYAPSALSGTCTGVFVGIVGGSEYRVSSEDREVDDSAQAAVGAASSLVANRVSYHLNLRGPSSSVDTACSSSLVALHRAVAALQSGQCSLALAGGVNLILDLDVNRAVAKTGMLSPSGRCRTFDAEADGYVRGEGVAALLLKPLAQARIDRDPIHAVIRGSAENHGGRSTGLTVPNPTAQTEVIRAAMERAGINPGTITYVETHGTGTPLGDPIEVNGLKAAFVGDGTNAGQPGPKHCGLGSVKTSIGHLEAMAGLAGVLKVVLAMEHGIIPANLHFRRRNPKIQLENTPFYIVDENKPWNRLRDGVPRRAGVSSFGFSGENAHVVLEERPLQPAEEVPGETRALVVLSARTASQLEILAADLAGHLARVAAAGAPLSLRNLAYTLQVGRDPLKERMAFLASSLTEVQEKLRSTGILRGAAELQVRDLLHRDAGKSFIRALADQGDWQSLGELWVGGAEVPWNVVYGERPPRRVALPPYPFERRRHWLPQESVKGAGRPLGPLLDTRMPAWETETSFHKKFDPADPVLADHLVEGRPILPAAAYLEMVQEAAIALEHSAQLRSVVFLRPLGTEQSGNVRVRFQRRQGRISFAVESLTGTEACEHARGELAPAEAVAAIPIDLPAWQEDCAREVPGAEIYQVFRKGGIEYGPYFQCIERLWLGTSSVLARLRLPAACPPDWRRYRLHPSLLDGALQTAALLGSAEFPPALRLPFSLERLDVFKALPRETWACVGAGNGAGVVDIVLTDTEGQVAAKLTGYAGRPVVKTVEPGETQTAPGRISRVLDRVEGVPADALGWDVAVAENEIQGFAALEELGRFTLLKAMRDRGLLGATGHSVSPAEFQDAFAAAPKFYPFCASCLGFLQQGGLVEPAAGNVRPTAKAFAPETERALSDLSGAWDRFAFSFARLRPHATLLRNCIEALPEVLPGRLPATDVLFPNGSVELISQVYQGSILIDHFNRLAALTVREYVAALFREQPGRTVRILEVGAGSGATTGFVAEAIRNLRGILEYCYSDVAFAFKRHGEKHFAERYPFMQFALLDIEKPIREQGFEQHTFDLVLGANVVHTTRLLQRSLQTIKALLRRDGAIVLLEGTEARLFNGLTYGLLDGWWAFQDPERRLKNAPLLSIDQWRRALVQEGFPAPRVLGRSGGLFANLFQVVLAAESNGALNEPVASNAPRLPSAELPASAPANPHNAEVLVLVTQTVRQVLQAEPEDLHDQDTFESLGVDSILSVEIVDRLNAGLPVRLRSTDVFNYPTPEKLARRILELLPEGEGLQPVADGMAASAVSLVEPPLPGRLEAPETGTLNPPVVTHPPDAGAIAIIGASGQFPGAPNLPKFWENLQAGRDSITEIPANRWAVAEYYREGRSEMVSSYSKWGGFLVDAEAFDPLFFRIAPREAEYIDPQQRLFLMESWRALEDAGYSDRDLDGRPCAVFVGCGGSDYDYRLGRTNAWAEPSAFTGNASAILAARIAYHLNLKGPSLAVDSACSSSLVAIHLACESLRARTSEIALAGGAAVICTPRFHVMASRSGMLSPGGRCHTFGAKADGFVPGEGIGVLVLKRLDDALRDGDNIQAIIRGSATNQDGKTNGITAPSAPSQTALEIEVYERFGIDPGTIGYVECHGTGTRLGDPIEIAALTDAFRRFTDRENFCAVGSVKSNIGHTLSAAGVAGVIKAMLALKHREIPPTLHSDPPNPHIDFSGSPFFVNRTCRKWDEAISERRRAAVSSFSFSGTNVHLVLEEAPALRLPSDGIKPAYLVTLSAATDGALARRRSDLFDWLDREMPSASLLAAISYTLNLGRSHLTKRAAWVVGSVEELRDALRQASVAPASTEGQAAGPQPLNTGFPDGNRPTTDLKALQGTPEPYRQLLCRLAAAYEQGQEVDWQSLHQGERPCRISLPTYPFELKPFWFNPNGVPERPAGSIGPLLDATVPSLASGATFVKRFGPHDRVLVDHQVSGKKILPGVAYLEMVYEAARTLKPDASLGFRAVTWLRPIEAHQECFDVHVTLRQEDGVLRFSVTDEPGSVTYAEGEVECLTASPFPPIVDPVGGAVGRKFHRQDLYSRFAHAGVVYGPWFQTIEHLSVGEDEVVGELTLDPAAAPELELYALHPALLDGALQVATGFLLADADVKPLLPFSVERVQVFGPCAQEVRVHVRGRPETGAQITLASPAGQLFVRIDGYVARPARDPLSDLLYTPGWIEKSIPVPAPSQAENVWLILAQEGLLENKLRERYPAAEVIRLDPDAARDVGSCHPLTPDEPEAWQTAVRKLQRPDLIHFVTGAVSGVGELDRARRGQAQGVLCLFRLIKVLREMGWWHPGLQLKVATRGVWPAENQAPGDPYSASVSGLIGSIGQECIEIDASCLDLGDVTPETVDAAVTAVVNEPPHKEVGKVAWRAGRRYQLVLWPTEVPAAGKSAFQHGGVYVVAGGAGGIGQAFSEHLAEKYQARLAWIGRRAPDAELARQIAAVERKGGELIYLRADLTSPETIQEAFATVRRQWGRVDGVVHSALVLRDQL